MYLEKNKNDIIDSYLRNVQDIPIVEAVYFISDSVNDYVYIITVINDMDYRDTGENIHMIKFLMRMINHFNIKYRNKKLIFMSEDIVNYYVSLLDCDTTRTLINANILFDRVGEITRKSRQYQ